jgi:serine/threonine protein kinase
METEFKIMGLNHPNLVRAIDAIESESKYYIIMKYYEDGDMFSYLKRQKKGLLTEHKAVFFLNQIKEGFKEMQQNQIMHRDFKLENIFIDGETISIGDFGLAKIDQLISNQKLGTLLYMAPEILSEKNVKFFIDL